MRLTIVLGLVVIAARADAEPLGNARAAYAEVALDGAVVASSGYLQPITPRAAWTVDLASALGDFDLADNRIRGGVRIDIARSGSFRLRSSLFVVRRATSNAGYGAQTFGTDLRLAPGVTKGRWNAELELAVEQGWLAHITATDTYRQLVYAGAEDGWYAMPGRTLRAGLAGSAVLGRVEVGVRVGFARHGGLDVLPPLYASVAGAWRF